MKGHYLVLVLPDGKHAIRREYVELDSEDETIAEATERWVQAHPSMAGRQRNRERTANALRESIVSRSIARPTSWHREQAEKAGLPWPVPVRRITKRRAA